MYIDRYMPVLEEDLVHHQAAEVEVAVLELVRAEVEHLEADAAHRREQLGVETPRRREDGLQPVADEDVEHTRGGPRVHLLLLDGVLDPRDGLRCAGCRACGVRGARCGVRCAVCRVRCAVSYVLCAE